MLYPEPSTVISPQDLISNVEVLFDGGEEGISIARLTWNGSEVIGMRWNVAQREWDNEDKNNEIIPCVGMPVSNSYPVWFILPNEMFDRTTDEYRVIQSLMKK